MTYTKRQSEIMELIAQANEKTGQGPTQKEIAQHFNVSGPTIHEHIGALERKGAISRITWEHRSIKVVDREWLAKRASKSNDPSAILDHLYSVYRHGFEGKGDFCKQCGLGPDNLIHVTDDA